MWGRVDCHRNQVPYDLMSICCVLLQRSINVGRITDKEALLQLAYQYMIPRPQRKYRANRRGLLMKAKQQKRATALNRLTYHDMCANKTYVMYVYVVTFW